VPENAARMSRRDIWLYGFAAALTAVGGTGYVAHLDSAVLNDAFEAMLIAGGVLAAALLVDLNLPRKP